MIEGKEKKKEYWSILPFQKKKKGGGRRPRHAPDFQNRKKAEKRWGRRGEKKKRRGHLLMERKKKRKKGEANSIPAMIRRWPTRMDRKKGRKRAISLLEGEKKEGRRQMSCRRSAREQTRQCPREKKKSPVPYREKGKGKSITTKSTYRPRKRTKGDEGG